MADKTVSASSSSAEACRRAAQRTGARALEMHSGTPALNAWYFSKFADRVQGDVLELGSGIGNISELLVHAADSLVATDVEDEYLALLRSKLSDSAHAEVHRLDLEKELPPALRSRTFDTVLSMNVIEHVADDQAAVRRIVDRLRPGGWMLTYVPAMPFAFGAMDEALGHHRRYTLKSFGTLMSGAGLQIARLEYMNLLGLAGWWFNGRVLRRRVPDARQVRVFEKLVPIVRYEEALSLPFGLGLICHARKRIATQ